MQSLGSIPEDFALGQVWEVELGTTLPAAVIGRRAQFDELIWDADGGFAPSWLANSALGGNEDDGYVLLLQRTAFSGAGLALFALAAVDSDGGDGNATSLQGVPISTVDPEVGQVLAYSSGGEAEWVDPASAGSGDVVGPASAVANRLAVFDGTTGKLLKDGGQTATEVAASARSWQTALDVDLSALSAQTLADGANTLAGRTWTGVNIAAAANLFAIVNGSGLEMKTNATNSEMFNNVRSHPHIKIRLSALLPADCGLDTELRLWLGIDVVSPTNNIEVVQAGLATWTFVTTQDQFVRCVNGRVTGTVYRHYDAVINGSGAFENATQQIADVDEVSVIHVKDTTAMRGRWLRYPQSVAAPITWPAARDLQLAAGFDLSSNRTTGMIANPRWTSWDNVALLLGASTSNTLNNTAFKGIIRRVRLDYRT